jgi:hypothetical protein
MSRDDTEEPKSKITSLSDKRKQKSDQVRKSYMPLEQRVAELEADMLRIIDSLAEIDYALNHQARITKLLVRAVTQISSRIPDPTTPPPPKK